MKLNQSFMIFIVCLSPLYIPSTLRAQDIAVAKEFYVHNLRERAMEIYIEILHNPKSNASNKAEALYYMGQLAYDDGRYSTALDDWKRLIKDYPNSSRALEIKDRLYQLREVLAKVSDRSITSTIAQSYIDNGDFWSGADDKQFHIDVSGLPKEELAMAWYERVIAEFPNTDAAEIAYERKLFTLLDNFYRGERPVLKTFQEFETAFPKSSYLQAFRYQIAQEYRRREDWDNSQRWLNRIIETSRGLPSFYTETAKARLTVLQH